MAENKIRLGGLWRNTSKSGVEYLSGRFCMAKLLIFKNDNKPTESAPDFTMFLVPDERPHERSDDRREAAPPNRDESGLPF